VLYGASVRRAPIVVAAVVVAACSLDPLPVPRADQGSTVGSGGHAGSGAQGGDGASSSATTSSSSSGGSGGDARGPVVLASGQQQPQGIAIDATHVFWTTGSSELDRVSKDGGEITVLASTLLDPIVSSGWAIAVDDTSVFWTSGSGQKVYRVGKEGGRVTVLLQQAGFPSSIALDTDQLYVTTYSDTLLSLPKVGGAAVPLTSEAGTFATGIALGGGFLFWTTGATVKRVPTSGGATVTVVSESGSVDGLTVHAETLYWSTHVTGSTTGGAIRRADLDGQQVATLVEGLDHPGALAVDGDTVFVLDEGSGEVLQVSSPGGQPIPLATGQVAPWKIAVDANDVYWIDKGDFARMNGTVMKAARSR